MQEVRCFQCKKKLGNINGTFEIKCPRCGYMNTGGVREDPDTAYTITGYRTVRPKDLTPKTRLTYMGETITTKEQLIEAIKEIRKNPNFNPAELLDIELKAKFDFGINLNETK